MYEDIHRYLKSINEYKSNNNIEEEEDDQPLIAMMLASGEDSGGGGGGCLLLANMYALWHWLNSCTRLSNISVMLMPDILYIKIKMIK